MDALADAAVASLPLSHSLEPVLQSSTTASTIQMRKSIAGISTGKNCALDYCFRACVWHARKSSRLIRCVVKCGLAETCFEVDLNPSRINDGGWFF